MATTVNIHEAKTQLSKLLAKAMQGEEVFIARSGETLVQLTPVAQQQNAKSWLGSLAHLGWSVPDDFDQMGRSEIEELFYGEPDRQAREQTKLLNGLSSRKEKRKGKG